MYQVTKINCKLTKLKNKFKGLILTVTVSGNHTGVLHYIMG